MLGIAVIAVIITMLIFILREEGWWKVFKLSALYILSFILMIVALTTVGILIKADPNNIPTGYYFMALNAIWALGLILRNTVKGHIGRF